MKTQTSVYNKYKVRVRVFMFNDDIYIDLIPYENKPSDFLK